MRWRVGVDVGGTFTDIAVYGEESEELRIFKVPSTPADPSIGVLQGLAHVREQWAGFEVGDVSQFLHGTTITTNALITRSHPPCALLVTGGLRGSVQVQNQLRLGNLYDLKATHQAPLVADEHVFEVPERIGADGEIVVALDRAGVVEIARRIRELGISSVAVCLLFSFANPVHEAEVGEILAQECPGVRVSLSSQILPRIREWPRISTMLLNASLEPLLVSYVDRLAQSLAADGLAFDRLFLMESNGGLMPFSAVLGGGRSVHTLLSGPAAAVQGAITIARSAGETSLLTLDVGGTSADVAFVRAGSGLEVTEGSLVGHDIYVPMLDVTTIGAGGGTISRVTGDGRLLVGPASAGADPGPACYGKGGTDPTTTDADLALGMLDPHSYLGGRMTLDTAATVTAIESKVAEPLGISLVEAATAMIRVNDVHMADAIRVFAAQRGMFLPQVTLVACGGAGPLHATAVATELGMNRVLVPQYPGAFSAVGLLCSDVVQDFVRSEITMLEETNGKVIASSFVELERQAVAALLEQGFDADAVRCHREVDARYAGQGFELRLEVGEAAGGHASDGRPDSTASEISVPAIVTAFHEEHERVYGHAATAESVEIVSYRIRAVVALPTFEPRPPTTASAGTPPAGPRERSVHVDGGWRTVPVVARADLRVADVMDGPVLVEQPDTTTFVPPGWRMTRDAYDNLVLNRETAS